MKNTDEEVLLVYADKEIDEEQMNETQELVHACEMQIVKIITQRLSSITFATYIGKGKTEEVSAFLEEHPCACVIFHQELTPLQLSNLETLWDCPVITRSDLIVEIFAKRAKSQEAKLQVESARLKKMLPRLIGSHTSLGRQGGGRNKGTGEKQIEIDRRRIKGQIHELDRQLKELKGNREVQRRQRSRQDLKQVALVGYTNAGKSTLMNALLQHSNKTYGSLVFEKDMLFATLDTSVRRIHNGKETYLLFDTVGFVSNLPHVLVHAFHSTLEEMCHADLLVQVIDASSSHAQMHMEVTKQTLQTIKADHIPMLYVYNKCDKSTLEYPRSTKDSVYMSAKTKEGIEELHQKIQNALYGEEIQVKLLIPYEKAAIIADIKRDCMVLWSENLENSTLFEVKMSKEQQIKYGNYVKF